MLDLMTLSDESPWSSVARSCMRSLVNYPKCKSNTTEVSPVGVGSGSGPQRSTYPAVWQSRTLSRKRIARYKITDDAL